MFKIRRFFAIFAILVTTGAWGAGYMCPTLKVYTSCASGLYLSDCGSYRDGRTISSPAAGNACNTCPAGYKCAGGAVCPAGNTYKVTLYNQGATTAGTTEYYYQYKTKGKCYYYTSSALTTCIGGTSGDTITVPQRTGYTFGGYYTGTNGTGTMYVDSTGVTRNNLYSNHAGNITLYAKWTQSSVTITYDLNGGSGTTPTAKSCAASTTCTLQSGATTSFHRTGYVFKGWSTNKSATTGSTTINVAGNTTVYAIWSACAANTYKPSSAQASAVCTACPANSVQRVAGRGYCDCAPGYSSDGTLSGNDTTQSAACKIYEATINLYDTNGTTVLQTIKVKEGQTIPTTAAPTKIGHKFVKYEFNDTDTPAKASFTANSSGNLVFNTFASNGATSGNWDLATTDKPGISNMLYDYYGSGNYLDYYKFKAVWELKVDPKFTVTTTALAANTTFSFTIGAAGTFYVDWGDGSAVQKITRTAVTSSTYSHTYANAGTYTIGFDGLATAYAAPKAAPESDCRDYSLSGVVSAISFANQPVASASGKIGAVFPTLASGKQPVFYYLFYKTNLTSVSGDLFDGVHGTPYPFMFRSAFDQSQLADIPSGLFAGISGSATQLFQYAFLSTTAKTIPADLFKNITGSAACMFAGTFSGTKQVTTIPATLFSGISGSAESMFAHTFSSTGITEIPATLFSGVSGGARLMFYSTFNGSKVTTVPEKLFSGINVPADGMFQQTFDNSELTSVPGGLFKSINSAADNMFLAVFQRTKLTSIPDGIFSHITGAPGSRAFEGVFNLVYSLKGYVSPDMFNKNLTVTSDAMPLIFGSTGLATACPAGMTQYKTGWESQWSSKVACTPCAAGTYKAGTGNAACAACAVGSYSDGTGNTACTACNNNGNWGKTTSGVGQTSCNATCPNDDIINGYMTATWNSNNTVSDLCMANSCVSGHYLDNGTCPRCDSFANGLYPHSAKSGTAKGREACFVRRNELPGQYIVAGAETATDCPAGTYMGTTDETAVHYGEGYECKTCGADTYAAGTGNTSCTACLENYHTFGEKVSAAACRISCPGGSYLATANATTCTHVGAGYYAEQSYVTQGSIGTRNQCPLNLTTIGYGVGADELGDCGRVLHVGDGKLYLRGERLTTPSLVVNVGGTNFYGNMSTDVKKMSDNVDKSLRINYNGATYSVYDDSGAVYVPGETPAVTIDPNLVATTIVPAAYNTAAGETEWSATLSDGTELSGRALCSATTAKNGETSAAGFTPDGTGTGCWCQLDNAPAGAAWVYGTTNASCTNKCGYFCANNMKTAKSVTFRTNLYQAAGIRVP